MSRRLRIESLGYHHVYNRGVAKSAVFIDEIDKAKFIELMASMAREYKFNIHAFCLMDNHYHILVQNTRENLSSGMRQLGAQYASYFNKRHCRVGHLWQDRFKSWYVLDDKYLFTLFKYIESNPLKAKMTNIIGEYMYCATYSMLKDAVPPFLQNSFVLRDYNTQELFDLLSIPLSALERLTIDAFHKTKYKHEDGQIALLHKEELSNYFLHVKNKEQRNEAIKNAYEDGYSKTDIAKKLSLSVAGVSKILKS
ncbi:transposase [Sulfurospirillum diekertiae]|nr:transposase [Sulfurospirillum diekertiae]QIR76345.1 transposase [Sulfurospirillum diekertiae]QIR78975.1 transposase [Sulfurospirillum diekertiae]